MKHPSKWRETFDPFTLSFKQFELVDILGYPHAGNDVFFVLLQYQEKKIEAYLKVERQLGADILREIDIMTQLNHPLTPLIIDYSLESPRFILTQALEGERLSVIVGNNENYQSLPYLAEYGKTLAAFHQLTGDFPPVKFRKFFNIPDEEFFNQHDLSKIFTYLKSHKPKSPTTCFVHGDFHYANLLWKDGHLSAILNFELSGTGIKEFDLAWALIVRPGQKFLKTKTEQQQFLSGYKEILDYNENHLLYYMVQIYCYFYEIGLRSKDVSYCDYIKQFFIKEVYH